MSDLELSNQAKIILSTLDDIDNVYKKELNVLFLGDEDMVEAKIGMTAREAKYNVIEVVKAIKSLEERSNRLENQLEKEFCIYRAKFLRAIFSSCYPIMEYEDDHEKYFSDAEALYNELLRFVKDQNEKFEENAKEWVKKPPHEAEAIDSLSSEPLSLWQEYAKNKKVMIVTELGLLLFLSQIDEDARHYERIIELVGIDADVGMRAAKSLEVLKEKERKKSSGGGCFIATAVYNSENAYDVLMLRNYRDEVLIKSIIGNLFIKFYYIISPPIAKAISRRENIKNVVKRYLIKPFIKYFIKK